MKPLISVIIPCYNQARYLPEALESLLAQSLQDWECIVVNDGSTDNTIEVAAAYEARDSRIRLVSQKNRGLSGARNRGIDEAKGNWIQFLDADDFIAPEKFQLQIDALIEVKGLALCYSDYLNCHQDDVNQTVKRDNFPLPRFILDNPLHDIAARWETQFSIPVHSYLFDANFFREKGIRFDETLPNHEDWDCWMQIFALEPIVKLTPGPLATYRICDAAMCMNKQRMWHGFRKAIRKQQRVFRHDPVMRRILSDKFREMKNAYGENKYLLVIMKVRKFSNRIYTRLMPWPIQKFIANISRTVR